jgi:hypothetical protein
MTLTRDNWVSIIRAFGSLAVLTLVVHIGIREWYLPYVRYGTGSAYMSTNLAVYSVGLKNESHADAENVTVTAAFADPLVDISTGEMGTPFNLSAGGKGEKLVTGIIKRLVPGEIMEFYSIT